MNCWPLLFLLLGGAQAASLTVFAASSLTEAFTEVGRAFEARTGTRTVFQFAGSQALRTQLEHGAAADVYATASSVQYDPLVKAGLLNAGRPFVRNRLAIITPASSRVHTLADLTRPGLKIVLADRAVPVGDYTRRLLNAVDQAGTYGPDFPARFLKNVVSEEPNVRQVALKVSLGQADAAVVYRTDVTPTLKKTTKVIALPTRFNQTATYPIGTLKNAPNSAEAQAFVQFVLSREGQNIMRKWGFLPPR